MNVLVVDDDEDTTALLSLALARQGWHVDAVSTLEGARQALNAQPYAVLITDLHLGDGSGMSLLRDPPRHPPGAAIVITGECSEEQRRNCLEVGFARCLTKPLSGRDIVGIVRTLLDNTGRDA